MCMHVLVSWASCCILCACACELLLIIHVCMYVSATWASCCMHQCAGLAGDPTQTNWFGSPASPLHCAVCMLLLLLLLLLSVCLFVSCASGRACSRTTSRLLRGRCSRRRPRATQTNWEAKKGGRIGEEGRGGSRTNNWDTLRNTYTHHHTFNKSLRVYCLLSTV